VVDQHLLFHAVATLVTLLMEAVLLTVVNVPAKVIKTVMMEMVAPMMSAILI